MGITKPLVKAGVEAAGRCLREVLPDLFEGATEAGVKALDSVPQRDWFGLSYLKRSEPDKYIQYQKFANEGKLPVMAGLADYAVEKATKEQTKAQELAIRQQQVGELTSLRAEGEHQFGLRSGQDKGLSAMSTGPELISGDKRIYQLSTELRKPYQELEETISANPYAKEFHHRFNKAVSSPYFERAWQLVDEGKATPEDIIALHRYALDKSVPAGDRQSAIMMFERIPHNEFHEFIRSIGLEPRAGKFEKTGVTSKYSKTPGRKLRSKPSTDSPLKMEQSRIKNLKTIEDLAADFQKTVDETIVPMNREAELLQEAWQAIDIGLRDELMDVWNKRNMARKAGNKQVADTLNKRYKALKTEAISQMKTNRASYGQELDEFGNPDPESYGRYEQMKELKERHRQEQEARRRK